MKKSLSVLLTLCMLLALVPVSAMAAGSVINVSTAAEAQEWLDGKHGSIDGKTINFTANIDTVLDLARPTAYAGSNTTYRKYNGDGTYATEITSDPTGMLAHSDYYRTVKNVTFTANNGVTVAGFTYSAGDVADASSLDPVRGTSGDTNYQRYSSLKNITFKGLTITGCIDFAKSFDCEVSNITFDGCTFTGATANKAADAAIHMWSDNSYYKNIVVKNSTISNYFQGVYLHCIDGATIANNSISNTKHNAIAFQSTTSAYPVKGNIDVKENFMENVSNRAVRFGHVENADVKMNNNVMVNCGDEDGELIKDVSTSSSAKINLENNYWDGENLSTALAGGFASKQPTNVGINGGSFTKPILGKYTASGYAPILNADGTYTVEVPRPAVTPTPAPIPTTAPATSVPRTGDNSPLAMWALLMVASAAAFVLLKRRMVNN